MAEMGTGLVQVYGMPGFWMMPQPSPAEIGHCAIPVSGQGGPGLPYHHEQKFNPGLFQTSCSFATTQALQQLAGHGLYGESPLLPQAVSSVAPMCWPVSSMVHSPLVKREVWLGPESETGCVSGKAASSVSPSASGFQGGLAALADAALKDRETGGSPVPGTPFTTPCQSGKLQGPRDLPTSRTPLADDVLSALFVCSFIIN
jgi:hypothetical protein